MIDFAKLRAPFPPEKVSWRVGPTTQDKSKGMALAFIDARDVMERLDDVCGPAGWQCRYSHANGKTVCDIGVKAGEEWVWKADGAGDSDMEAEKGALSDAFKRAAVRFGVGRYLYDVEAVWVAIEQRGKSYAIKDSEIPKLRGVLGGKPAPKEPQPQPKQASPSEAFALEAVGKLKALDSVAALSAWADANKSHLEALPDDLKRTVRAAYSQRTKELTKEAA